MSHNNDSGGGTDLSRRDVLKTAGGAVAAAGFVGSAAADGTREVNVGFEGLRGRGAVERAAESVKREFNFEAMTIRAASEAIDALEKNPNIRYVEDNGEMHALAETVPWGIDRVGADVLHDDGETGNGADIAILDTGIDSDHYDLADRIGGGKCFTDECCGEATGGIFGCDDNDNECLEAWDDDNDHGTHCAGTAGAIDNDEGVVGVSTEATLWAGKVLTGCGSGSYDAIAAGIEWTADEGFDVASMSLGGDESSVVKDACQYAYDEGVLLVAAAGNDGECTDCVGSPATYDEVIAVSATSEDDSLASFSSTGPEVELAAPGEGVLSTVPTETSSDGLETFSGTSMACPHVSGAGAQLMANGYSNTEARQQLRDTAEDIGLGDNEQGYGLLDAEAAVLDGDGGGDDENSAPTVDDLSASEVETDNDDAEFDVDWAVSDDDGNLDSVELKLTDGTDDETEDTETVDVSGDTASDTTRLVAAGDDGSGNDYTVEAVVTDTEDASDSDTTTVSETEETESELAVSTGDATDVGTDSATLNGSLDDLGGADSADVYFEWGPSGDLSNNTSEQTLSSTGDFSDEITGLESDTEYEFQAVAEASDGDSDTGSTVAFTTDTDDGGDNAPVIDQFDVSTRTSGPWFRVESDWAVSDEDGDLDSVTTDLLDAGGSVLDSESSNVSGSSASDTHEVKTRDNADSVRLTVTDASGNEAETEEEF